LHARVNEGVALLKEVRLRVEYMDKALQDANAIFSAVTMRRGLIDEARTEAQRQAITSATQNDASTLAKEAHVVRNEPSALQKLSEHNRFKNEQGDIVLFFDNYAPRESELIAQLQKLRSVLSISSLD
jgi:hypothetical protein